jgi:hypothetical protein
VDNVILFPVERRLEQIRTEQQASSPTGVSVSQGGSFNFSVSTASGTAATESPPEQQMVIPSAHPPQPSRRVDDQAAWVLLGSGRVRHRLLALAYDEKVGWRAEAACGRSGAPDYSKWSGEKCQRCLSRGWR